ncbi:MAG: helix-turn-helix domain-containing protein [Bacteroidota bacterium]|nr:helix-turn-helix domain-containing protein [Bacteroidota bacterium]
MAERVSQSEIEAIRALRNDGNKLSYIVYKVKRDKKTILKYITNKHLTKPWTPNEIQRALGLRKFGFSNGEIGEQLGRTRAAVSQMFVKAKLSGKAVSKGTSRKAQINDSQFDKLKKLGWTQTRIAEEFGVAKSTISRYKKSRQVK